MRGFWVGPTASCNSEATGKSCSRRQETNDTGMRKCAVVLKPWQIGHLDAGKYSLFSVNYNSGGWGKIRISEEVHKSCPI